jgi:hypothetical protein
MRILPVRPLAIALMTSLAACGTMSEAEEVPATITNAVESRVVLQRAVSAMLKRDSVVLADDAFVAESTLILEPARLRDPQGNLLQGRELRPAERFRLVKEGNACILLHASSGTRTILTGVRCAPRR